jgi:hypothetical protein
MKDYICNDGNGEEEITAKTPEDAAQKYVDGGDWGDSTETTFVSVCVTPLDEDGEPNDDEQECITISVDPEEPECSGGEHDWQSPHELVGGLKENPGVYGHGGGVIITEVCSRCGAYRIRDTWAQNPENGEQGLHSVTYRDPDDESLLWLESLSEE